MYNNNCPALIQGVFYVDDRFWPPQNRCPKKLKKHFFHDMFHSWKAHAHCFTVLIYLATWITGKLGIFTHYTSISLPQTKHQLTNVYILYRSPAAFHEGLITVMIALLCTKKFCITPGLYTKYFLFLVKYGVKGATLQV